MCCNFYSHEFRFTTICITFVGHLQFTCEHTSYMHNIIIQELAKCKRVRHITAWFAMSSLTVHQLQCNRITQPDPPVQEWLCLTGAPDCPPLNTLSWSVREYGRSRAPRLWSAVRPSWINSETSPSHTPAAGSPSLRGTDSNNHQDFTYWNNVTGSLCLLCMNSLEILLPFIRTN